MSTPLSTFKSLNVLTMLQVKDFINTHKFNGLFRSQNRRFCRLSKVSMGVSVFKVDDFVDFCFYEEDDTVFTEDERLAYVWDRLQRTDEWGLMRNKNFGTFCSYINLDV